MKAIATTVLPSLVFAGLLALAPPASTAAGTEGLTRLENQVRKELVTLPYYSVFDNFAYKVEGSTVTLTGKVTRPTLKSGAERVVERIEGVDKVVNRIEVLPVSPNDDRIRINTFRAIYYNPMFNRLAFQAIPPIHIIVENGDVTLEGVVNNRAREDRRRHAGQRRQRRVLGDQQPARRARLRLRPSAARRPPSGGLSCWVRPYPRQPLLGLAGRAPDDLRRGRHIGSPIAELVQQAPGEPTNGGNDDGVPHGVIGVAVASGETEVVRGAHQPSRLPRTEQPHAHGAVLDHDNSLPAAASRRRAQTSRQAVETHFGALPPVASPAIEEADFAAWTPDGIVELGAVARRHHRDQAIHLRSGKPPARRRVVDLGETRRGIRCGQPPPDPRFGQLAGQRVHGPG